jgi:4-amino-4-deoxy-L-arabinose transferase-like glycosyltransferase
MKMKLWPLLAALALGILFRLPSLNLPMDRDEGEYASLAMASLNHGGTPYKDYLEQKPPLAILIYALPQALGFLSVTALRITALLWQLASITALYLLTLKLSSKASAAMVAAILYAALSAGVRVQGPGANAELWVTLPITLAMLVAPIFEEGAGSWLAFGALVGLASLAKQSALPAALLLPLLAQSGSWRQRLKAVALSMAACAGLWLLCLIFFNSLGAAGDFWHCVVTYNLSYADQGQVSAWRRLFGALLWIAGEQGLLWLFVPYAIWKAIREQERPWILSLAWLGAAALGIAMSGRYYPHYFQIAAAPLALAAGLAFSELEGGWRRGLAWAGLALFALQFVLCDVSFWSAPTPADKTLRLLGVETFAAAPDAAQWIDSQTPEGSRLWIWGSEAEVYFLSRRMPATRFLFSYPFTGEAPAWPNGRQELEDGLLDTRTAAVLLAQPLPDRGLTAEMLKRYQLHSDVAPPFMIGIRKP